MGAVRYAEAMVRVYDRKGAPDATAPATAPLTADERAERCANADAILRAAGMGARINSD